MKRCPTWKKKAKITVIFLVLATLIFVWYQNYTIQNAKAFEQLPRSLTYVRISQSGSPGSDGSYIHANPGDTVAMWLTVKNQSTNPKAQVWYGRGDLPNEGPNYPNAHAIGVGTAKPRDSKPNWLDDSSFTINGNRFMYYDGQPVAKGQTMTLSWNVKIAANATPGTYNLHVALVREFDEWGTRVNLNGSRYRYQDVLWKFVIGENNQITAPEQPEDQNKYDKYTEGQITTAVGKFPIKMVTVDLNNPNLKIITDTAVSSDLDPTPWPILAFNKFLSRNSSIIAAINGCYFWPAEKSYGGNNTFNPMVYNSRSGVMINERRNSGNLGGLLVFDTANKPHFFLKTSEFKSTQWFESTYGTKIAAAIANVPALVYNSNINYGDGDMDTNMNNTKAVRAGIGIKGNSVFLVVVRNATVPDLAQAMKALGSQYALNLDGGGSAALYYRGDYKQSPGRSLPNIILFSQT